MFILLRPDGVKVFKIFIKSDSKRNLYLSIFEIKIWKEKCSKQWLKDPKCSATRESNLLWSISFLFWNFLIFDKWLFIRALIFTVSPMYWILHFVHVITYMQFCESQDDLLAKRIG